MARQELDERTYGMLLGVALFAYTSSESWAQSGVHYVGTTGITLRAAKEQILRERGYDPEQVEGWQ